MINTGIEEDSKLNFYLKNHYQTLVEISQNITNGKIDEAQELLHTVIVYLLERHPGNFDKFNTNNDFKYYISRCLYISWKSKTSQYYRNNKKETQFWVEYDPKYNNSQIEEATELEKMDFMEQVEKEFTELDILRKGILSLYLQLGSMKKVAQQTKIPLSSVSRYIREAREIIKKKLDK